MPQQDVECYLNLHKNKFSIRARSGIKRGLVIGHQTTVLLRGVTPRISEAGRQRVLRERRKNVHACLRGTLVDRISPGDEPAYQLSYNPYIAGHFLCYQRYRGGEVRPVGGPKVFVSAEWARLVVIGDRCVVTVYAPVFQEMRSAA